MYIHVRELRSDERARQQVFENELHKHMQCNSEQSPWNLPLSLGWKGIGKMTGRDFWETCHTVKVQPALNQRCQMPYKNILWDLRNHAMHARQKGSTTDTREA